MRNLLHTLTALLAFAPLQASTAIPLQQLADEQFAFAAKQYRGMLATIASDKKQLPRSYIEGKVRMVPPEDWVAGFFPGCLWLVHEHTGDADLRKAAEDFTHRMESIQHFTGNHDTGFMLGCSYGEGYRITRNPAYQTILVNGARSLAKRFNPKVGLIRSWDFGPWKYPVIIDNMMNLELLVNAAQVSGDKSLLEIALAHADRTLVEHYRPDASSFHLVDYDPATGAVLKKQTVQGYSDPSSWSRGQAWGLYGYTRMYTLTKKPEYLALARRIADFIISHPRLPADGIPYWDYDVPHIPDALRDVAAGAITCSALFDLADEVGADGAKYRALAEKQLRTLSTASFRAGLGENGHFLLMHGVGHLPEKGEVDVPLMYADYYFLEALAHVATKKKG